MSDYQEELEKRLERASERRDKALHERSPLAQLGLFGTVGLLFIIPVVGGAYLGAWLDGLDAGFSTSWTVSLIIVGIFVGAYNVYYFIRNMGGL